MNIILSLKYMTNYIIDKLLGKGSFGKVYLIKNKTTGYKRVAKFIKISAFVDRNLYQNEINILKKLSKKCFEHLICLDHHFTYTTSLRRDFIVLITNYIDGISLKEFLQNKENYNLSNDDFLFIAYQLVYTLYKLHKKYKIVHKDLKPENIMINPKTLKLYIIDFGISCDTYRCIAGGTPIYMSPEMSHSYDQYKFLSFKQAKKSDIFSIGIILLELLDCKNYKHINKATDSINNILNIETLLTQCNLHNEPIEYLIKNTIHLNPDKRMKIQDLLHYLETLNVKTLYNQRMSMMRKRRNAIKNIDSINKLLKISRNKTYNIKDIKYIDSNFQRQKVGGNFDKKKAKFPRKMSKEYCINTKCDKMGFSQKASCRYYKNCYEK